MHKQLKQGEKEGAGGREKKVSFSSLQAKTRHLSSCVPAERKRKKKEIDAVIDTQMTLYLESSVSL